MNDYIDLQLERLHDAMARGDNKAKVSVEKEMSDRLNQSSDDACVETFGYVSMPAGAVFPSNI